MKYKLRGCIFSLFWLFTLLLQGQVAWAETDLLNLSAYQEASTPEYGENVLVGQDEKSGVKYLTFGKEAGSTGRLKFPVSLSGDFDVVVKVKPDYFGVGEAFFLTADEYKIKVGFYLTGAIEFQDGSNTGSGDGSNAWKMGTTNTLKLSVSGNVAKLYVNDVFYQQLTLKADLTYTQLLYQGQNSQLYQVILGGSGGSAQPPVTGAQTDLLNLSAYQEATTPLYGENVLVSQDEKTEIKWLTGGKEADSTGRLKFPVNLSGDFEVVVKVNPYDWQEFFLTADEYRIKIGFSRYGGVGLQAGSDTDSWDASSAWMNSTTNTLKLSVSENVAKVYVNDVFSQKLTLKAGLTYTQLLYEGLDQDSKLYKLKVGKTSTTTTTPVSTVKPCGCPSLGKGHATDANGKSVTTETKHEAGISVNSQPPATQVKQKLSDTVDVIGNIIVDPVDIGQSVDTFVYAAATFPGSSAVSYYMLGPGLTILAWNQQPASLVAFSSGTLAAVQVVQMYSGTFYYPGTLKVFFGYRLPNGTVITSSAPIDITIEQ